MIRVATRAACRVAIVAGAVGWVAQLAPVPAAEAAAVASQVGVVIVGQGTYCVPWHSGITGDEALNDVASVQYRRDGIIVAINGVPASATADSTHYWSYWHNTGAGWAYSNLGAGASILDPGTVDGWSYVNGSTSATPPPQTSYSQICPEAPVPSPSQQPAPTTAARTTVQIAPALPPSTPSASSPARITVNSDSSTPTRSTRKAPAVTTSSSARLSPSTSSDSGTTSESAGIDASPAAVVSPPSAGSPVPMFLAAAILLAVGGGGGLVAWRRRLR